MKLFLSLVALVLAFILINVINFPASTKSALYIAFLGLLVSAAGAYGIIYEAKLRMEYSLLFNLANKVYFLAFVFLAVVDHWELNVFIFASVSATLVHNLLMVLFAKRLVDVSFDVDLPLIKQL